MVWSEIKYKLKWLASNKVLHRYYRKDRKINLGIYRIEQQLAWKEIKFIQ